MKIAHLADLHFGRENRSALDAAAELIKAVNTDAVVISGDLTQRGKREEFVAAAEWLQQLDMPALCVPGNHDTPLLNVAARVAEPFGRFEKYLGQYTSAIKMNGVSVRGLNTSRGWQARTNWAEGSVNLDALAMAVGPADDANIRMIACHHPFLQPSGIKMITQTNRGAEASARLAASPVSVLLTGHVHTPHAEVIGGDDGRYLAITSGTLSTRLRSVAPSFNFITVSDGEINLSMHTFEGDGFSELTQRSWAAKSLEPMQIHDVANSKQMNKEEGNA